MEANKFLGSLIIWRINLSVSEIYEKSISPSTVIQNLKFALIISIADLKKIAVTAVTVAIIGDWP